MGFNVQDIKIGGSYFKGEDFVENVALLIEVTNFERQLPTNYGPKDTVTADITAFASVDDIDNDNGSLSSGVKIQQVDLARRLADLVGSAAVVRLEKLAPTAKLPNGAWVWRPVDADVRSKVVAFGERREAALNEALSGDDVPDYLK